MTLEALINYRPVRYSHILIEPGESHTLTADPWAYLYSFLIRAKNRTKGIRKRNHERAIFYAELADSFYRAAEVSQLPAQATLLYYGMLNLAKCFLSVRGLELETKIEHHGASLPFNAPPGITIARRANASIHILSEFSKELGGKVTEHETIQLKEILSNIPELHGLYSGVYTDHSAKFLPVDIKFCTNDFKTTLFAEISYQKKNEKLIAAGRLLKGNRRDQFTEGVNKDGRVIHKTQKTRRPKNWKNLTKAYRAYLREFSKYSICSMLTRNGYQYHVNLEDPKYHHLLYSLMAMFYLGSAARYRPSMMRELMDSEMRPLITEAAALCPRQFQYHLVSLITGELCAVPFAAID